MHELVSLQTSHESVFKRKMETEMQSEKNREFFENGLGFLSGSAVKNQPANSGDARDEGWIPQSGRSPGEGNGNPLQWSCLGNAMDRGTGGATLHGVKRVGDD